MSERWSESARRKFTSPEYRAWTQMKVRCYDRNHEKFSIYGGRGIAVCQRWLDSFDAFLADVGPRPSPKHSIDRKDNDGNYEPKNCRWATRKEQANNRAACRKLTIGGVTLTLTEWAERNQINVNTMFSRLDYGWSEEDAVTVPTRKGAYRRRAG